MMEHKVLLFLMEPGQIESNIAGLVANKIMAKYQRPTCILTKCEVTIMDMVPKDKATETYYRGSARGYERSGITNFKDICENIKIRFNDAGHMLGSSIIEVWINENGKTEKAVFSGDIGNNDIPLLASPTMIESADYLIMESTYGNRLHIKNETKAEDFLNIASSTLLQGGNVIIPSFAVGRTQEILYELNKIKDGTNDAEFINKYNILMNTPVYVDSPLAISATEIFKQNEDLFDDDVKEEIQRGDNPLEFDGLKFTKTAEESKALKYRTMYNNFCKWNV